MPQIIAPAGPTSSGTPRILQVTNLGTLTPPSPISLGAGFGNALGDTGNKLLQIADRLQDQQDDIDLATSLDTYGTEVAKLRIDLNQAEITSKEDIFNKSKVYTRSAAEVREKLEENMSNRIKGKFRAGAAKNFQAEGLQVYTDALKKWNLTQVATLNLGLIELSKKAALADTPDERDQLLALANNSIEASVARGLISPVEGGKLKEDLEVGAQTDQFAITAHRDYIEAKELDEMGKYPKVPPRTKLSIMDSAVAKQEARVATAQRAYDKAIVHYNESVQHEIVSRIHDGTITRDFIEDNKYAFTAEQHAGYLKALDEQEAGISTGDPKVEQWFTIDVSTATPDNANAVMNHLLTLYRNNQVSRKFFEPAAHRLSTLIQTANTLARQDVREKKADVRRAENKVEAQAKVADTRQRETVNKGLSQVLSQVDLQLHPIDKSEDMDGVVSEARGSVKAEIQDRVAKGEDPHEAYRKAIPKGLAQVQSRGDSRLKFIKESLLFPSKKLLNENRAKIGEDAYFEQLKLMEEYLNIMDSRAELEAIRQRNEGKRK